MSESWIANYNSRPKLASYRSNLLVVSRDKEVQLMTRSEYSGNRIGDERTTG